MHKLAQVKRCTSSEHDLIHFLQRDTKSFLKIIPIEGPRRIDHRTHGNRIHKTLHVNQLDHLGVVGKPVGNVRVCIILFWSRSSLHGSRIWLGLFFLRRHIRVGFRSLLIIAFGHLLASVTLALLFFRCWFFPTHEKHGNSANNCNQRHSAHGASNEKRVVFLFPGWLFGGFILGGSFFNLSFCLYGCLFAGFLLGWLLFRGFVLGRSLHFKAEFAFRAFFLLADFILKDRNLGFATWTRLLEPASHEWTPGIAGRMG